MVLSGCMTGGEPLDEGSAEQAIVTAPAIALQPPTAEELLDCLDLQTSFRWLRDHAFYTESCFSSWTINVPIDCTLFEQQITGTVKLAGQTMASLPRTGWGIRGQAALAAAADVGFLLNGTLRPRLDIAVSGPGSEIDSCTAPVDGRIHTDLGATLSHPALGSVSTYGSVDWIQDSETKTRFLDFELSATAEPNDEPVVSGELVGADLERPKGEKCPSAGTVTFTGTVGEDSATNTATFVGDGAVIIDFWDGRVVGPDTPQFCE